MRRKTCVLDDDTCYRGEKSEKEDKYLAGGEKSYCKSN